MFYAIWLQCYVKFGEESNKYAIVFDDKTEESLDINPEVVSLSTLLRLGKYVKK